MTANYLVIGAMKCGTSTICAYLEDHPEAFMVPGAEPRYFSHDANFARGVDWYESHFAGWQGESRCGEGSNDYLALGRFPAAPARIHAYNPEMKLIVMVRHPLDRIVSAWIQSRSDSGDNVPPTLDRAVYERPDLFVDQSLYGKNIDAYRALFPPEQIFVGFMEDLQTDPQALFDQLTEFLGIARRVATERTHVNPSSGKKVLSPAYSTLRRLPGAQLARHLSPRPLKRYVKQRILSRKLDAKPEFSPAVRADLVALLRDDARTFLAAHGKPADFWQLEP